MVAVSDLELMGDKRWAKNSPCSSKSALGHDVDVRMEDMGPLRRGISDQTMREWSERRLEDPSQDDVDQNSCSDDHAGDLKDCNGVALFRHPRESGGTAFQVRGKRGEHFVLNIMQRVSYWYRMYAISSARSWGSSGGVRSDRVSLGREHYHECRWSHGGEQRLCLRESSRAHCFAYDMSEWHVSNRRQKRAIHYGNLDSIAPAVEEKGAHTARARKRHSYCSAVM